MKYMSRPKCAAVKDIDIDIANILGQKYLYHIDIGHGDVDPPLLCRCYFVDFSSASREME